MTKKKQAKLVSSAKFIAEAALDNPNLGWLEFILTDAEPNENSQGIKKEAFAGLIQTGLFMPIKMAIGEIRPDHSDAKPLGAIAALDADEDKILGKAALWKIEREGDYKILTAMSSRGEPINISWEVVYTESEVDDNNVEWLDDPVLTGATIVSMPAYAGRTPVLSVAAKDFPESEAALEEAAKWTRKYINDLPDSAFLYIEKGGEKDEEGKTVPRNIRHFPYKDADGKIDCPHLKNAISRIPQSTAPGLDKEAVQKKARSLYAKHCGGQPTEEEAALKELEIKMKKLEQELEDLRAYKKEREEADARAAKIKARGALIAEAGIEVSMEDNEDFWLCLTDEAFETVLTMLKERKPASASLPDVSGNLSTNSVDLVREGFKQLREGK